MTKQRLGLYRGMPFDVYHAVDAVSSSGLKTFARSPWHYRNRVEVKPTKSMLTGTLVHCALLEANALAARYVVTPDTAPPRPSIRQVNAKKPSPETVAAVQWWSDFQAQCEGKQIISADDYATMQAQVRAVQAEPELAKLLARGEGEVSLFWVDEATGLYCKARIDWLSLDGNAAKVLELKSTADESPSGFGRTAARLRYALQRAHYMAGVQAVGLQARSWTWGAVSSKPPFLAVPYELTDELKEQADDDRAELLQRLAWCNANNKWPAYGEGVQLLDFPSYAKRSGEVEVSFVDEDEQ